MSEVRTVMVDNNIKAVFSLTKDMLPIRIIYSDREYELKRTEHGIQMIGVKKSLTNK